MAALKRRTARTNDYAGMVGNRGCLRMMNDPYNPPEYTRLRSPVAVWASKYDAALYAYPLGERVTFGGKILPTPRLKDNDWEYMGTLPAHLPIANPIVSIDGRVTCDLAGTSVVTSIHALEA